MNYKTSATAAALMLLLGGLMIYGVSWIRTDAEKKEVAVSRSSESKNQKPLRPKTISLENEKVEKPLTEPPVIKPKASEPSVEKVSESNAPASMMAGENMMARQTQKSSMMKQEPTPVPTKKPAMKQKEKIASKKPLLANNDFYDGNKIKKSEAGWRKLLTPMQFYVLRQKGTEKPYTGKYTENKHSGEYHCAACGLKLFVSEAKYESNTGWASFFKPFNEKNILEETDTSLEETRTEVLCPRCGSHLGHVFDDGPKPTGLRYCINSAALKFKKRK